MLSSVTRETGGGEKEWGIRSIAGHRHRHSCFLYLSPVLEHSGTELGPFIPVPDWFRNQHFCSYRYGTDWMPDSLTFPHFKKRYALHVHTAGFGGCERDTQLTSKLQAVESDTP